MKFFVRCRPMGKGRPRFTKAGRTYTPEKTIEGERLVRASLMKAFSRGVTSVPIIHRPHAVSVKIEVWLPIPESWPKGRQADAREGRVPATKKPDADNYGKLVLDALNGVAWDDDSQVVALTVTKAYSPGESGFSIEFDEVRCG